LVPILRSGQLVRDLPGLEAIRLRCRDQLAALPERLRRLDGQPDYPITYSDVLEADAMRLMKA
jgi:nicotinate phosphoribosyltransferase